MLIGTEATALLQKSAVVIFGLGGVGSYAAEATARAGVGKICLVDGDVVAESNLNRQLVALSSTVGKSKARVMSERIADISKEIRTETMEFFYTEETADRIDLAEFDYIIDAIDMVSAKLLLIEQANRQNVPIISAMGTGNKLDPTAFMTADIYETSVCPLCRVMRRELRKRGIERLKVVYSKEEPISPREEGEAADGRRQTPGSVSFVPPVAGMILAGEVIKALGQTARQDSCVIFERK